MSTDTTRPELGNPRGHWTFLSAIVASALLVGIGMWMANRHRHAVTAAAWQQRAEAQQQACSERGTLFVARSALSLPLSDPTSDVWESAPSVTVPLQRQNIAMPVLNAVTIESARLQGLTDGSHIAWRVSWKDDTVDANVDMARFSDAVALQFAIARDADFSMGGRDKLVQILHWKALWQKDVDEHFQDVQDLHPNYWADLYWFAEGRPYTIPASFQDPRSHEWFAAYSAGNPMADFNRVLPVEELSAEGYGSLTSQPSSITVGRGRWDAGEWSVVFGRPLRSDDSLDYQFWRGGRGNVGIAVWDGGVGNSGGRKHWTNWIEFEVSL